MSSRPDPDRPRLPHAERRGLVAAVAAILPLSVLASAATAAPVPIFFPVFAATNTLTWLAWCIRRDRRKAPMNSPTPPEDVALVLRSGRFVPCELVYDGQQDGQNRWVSVVPDDVDLGDVVGLRATRLPAKTSIVLSARDGR